MSTQLAETPRLNRPARGLVPAYPDGAVYLGIGKTTMFRLLKDGEIPSVTIGRKRLVEPAELDRYISQLRSA